MKYILPILITCGFLFAWDKSFGETVTTGNLLPNAGDGVDWNSSSTDQINSANSSGYVTNGSTVNGFDITCTNQSNCGYRYSVGGDFEVTGTATVTADNINLTSNSITQSMLDNGVTLNSYIDVANCESTQGNCESKGGSNDSHTTTIVLKDSSGNVLSTTTQTRTEVTGFQGNCNGYPGTTTTGITAGCGQYNDRIIYLGLGANKVDWSWEGTDSNYTNQSRQGPNLLGASLNMTYNNTPYQAIDEDTQDVIDDIDEDIIDIIDDIPEDFDWNTDDLYFEEEYVIVEDNFTFEEIYFEDIDTISIPLRNRIYKYLVRNYFLDNDVEYLMKLNGIGKKTIENVKEKLTNLKIPERIIPLFPKQARNDMLEVIIRKRYPRLDGAVTEGHNHLIRLPGSVHMGTGYITQIVDKPDKFQPHKDGLHFLEVIGKNKEDFNLK